MAYYVDSSIQYRGYNTFRMEAPAKVKSWIFGVEGLETISHSFYAYATTTLSSAVRTRTRWISGNGITLSVEDHTWTITEGGFFNHIKIEGITVPTGAVYAQLELHNTSGKTYWVGLIKSEAGDQATDFTHNLSGQLTRITASGIYTGTITAQQVILSSTTGENLPERLTTINGNMVQLTSKTSTVESKLTQIEAGKITLSSNTSGSIAGMTLTSDRLQFSSSGAYMRLMGRVGYDPIRIGSSADTINFRVSTSGYLTASGATLSGTITATGGSIGGFTIKDRSIESGSGSNYVWLSGDPSFSAILIGGTTYGTAKFGVLRDGSMKATSATISGKITSNSSSSLAGSLSSTSGTHAGYVSGSLSNTSGRHNGTHYGYHEGQGYTYSNSTLGGSLSGTLGSHNGYIYSGSGSLGGVSFQTYSGTTVRLNGSMSLQYALLVYGNIHYQGSLIKMSDGTMKTDIKEAKPEDYLNSFYNLKLKNFRFKNDDKKKNQIGIIAQDFIKDNDNELIDLVVGAKDGYLNVKYENLYLMNILATQKLNARVKKLEEKLNERI